MIWQSDALTRALASVLIVPLTNKLGPRAPRRDRGLAGNRGWALSRLGGPRFSDARDPQSGARVSNPVLTESEVSELELATDEALGCVEP